MSLDQQLSHLASLDTAIRAAATECEALGLLDTTEAIATLTAEATKCRLALARRILARRDAPEAREAARMLLEGIDLATAAELRRDGRLQ